MYTHILIFTKTPNVAIYLDEKGTYIQEMSAEKREVHLMQACMHIRAILKREGSVVIGRGGSASAR